MEYTSTVTIKPTAVELERARWHISDARMQCAVHPSIYPPPLSPRTHPTDTEGGVGTTRLGGTKTLFPPRRHKARPPYSPAEPKTDLARSTPKKQAAFAGNARSMAGATPRYRAAAPSSLKRVLKGRADKQGIAGEGEQKTVSMLDKGGWSPRARQI